MATGQIQVDSILDIGRRAGLVAVGVCRAEPFTEVAETLHQRKEDGLHGGMQFTYRNPERSTDPSRILPGAASLVVGALDFWRGEPPHPDDGLPYGRVAAYAREDHYAALRSALGQVAEALRAAGHRAVVVADENGLVDRAAAYRAAIGWWGKSSNILVPGAGSLVVLGAVVTDAPLCDTDPEPMADGCGSCRQCLDGCPTGAIVAPGMVDARRCLAWLVQESGVFRPEFRVALGDRIYGCDDCAEVCPPNRVRVRLDNRSRPRARTRPGCPWSICSTPPTRTSWPGSGAGTSRGAGPDTCGATRWWRWATSGIRPSPGSVPRSAGPWPIPIRWCAPTPSGARGVSA